MSLTIGNHPAGSAGVCLDTMILPPQAQGRLLHCQLERGHPGHHAAQDPDTRTLRRVWPRAGGPEVNRSARAASGANVTPIKKGRRP